MLLNILVVTLFGTVNQETNMKLLIIVLLTLFIASCSTMSALFSKGAELNDDALTAAEAVICKAASIGSIMRRYGISEEKALAWKELCSDHNNAADIILNN